ncbi:MAG: hypothetical protein JF595_11335 [Sphingomonadales bacterium]|nr:hypothetical protein [Sphingomonadales bacterium]
MKILRLAVVASLAVLAVTLPSTAMANDRHGWNDHHRHCYWTWRHHHRVRVCHR